MLNLHNKVVVITGAGRGLGAAFAIALAPTGCEMVLCARRVSDVAVVADNVIKHGGRPPKVIELDLSNAISVQQASAQIASLHTRVDILINNGSMWLEASKVPYDAADVLSTINAATTGTFLLIQSLRPLMQTSDSPDVLTIGSISGLPNAILQSVSVPFYAAKRGQVAIAEGLRQEYAGSKFRSLLINPPYLDDIQPHQAEWQEIEQRQKGARATNRDVIDAALFALSRPRHISLTLNLDADTGGMFP